MAEDGSLSRMELAICCERVSSGNLRVNGSLEGSNGDCMTVALASVLVDGLTAKTVSSLLNGSGRWSMLSRSALEVKVKEPPYFSLNCDHVSICKDSFSSRVIE